MTERWDENQELLESIKKILARVHHKLPENPEVVAEIRKSLGIMYDTVPKEVQSKDAVLSVEFGSITPSSPKEGEPFQVDVSVAETEGVATDGLSVRLSIDSAGIDQVREIDPLRGNNTTVAFDGITIPEPGDYTAVVTANAANAQSVSEEHAFSVAETEPSEATLEMGVIVLTPSEPEEGEPFSVAVDVEETSGVQTEGLSVRLDIDGIEQTVAPDQLSGTVDTVTFEGLTIGIAGEYTAVVTADATNATAVSVDHEFSVAESEEPEPEPDSPHPALEALASDMQPGEFKTLVEGTDYSLNVGSMSVLMDNGRTTNAHGWMPYYGYDPQTRSLWAMGARDQSEKYLYWIDADLNWQRKAVPIDWMRTDRRPFARNIVADMDDGQGPCFFWPSSNPKPGTNGHDKRGVLWRIPLSKILNNEVPDYDPDHAEADNWEFWGWEQFSPPMGNSQSDSAGDFSCQWFPEGGMFVATNPNSDGGYWHSRSDGLQEGHWDKLVETDETIMVSGPAQSNKLYSVVPDGGPITIEIPKVIESQYGYRILLRNEGEHDFTVRREDGAAFLVSYNDGTSATFDESVSSFVVSPGDDPLYFDAERVREFIVADGVTDGFVFPHKISDATDIVVALDGADQVIENDYTVSGVGDENGVTITFNVIPPENSTVRVTYWTQVDIKRQTMVSYYVFRPGDTKWYRADRGYLGSYQGLLSYNPVQGRIFNFNGAQFGSLNYRTSENSLCAEELLPTGGEPGNNDLVEGGPLPILKKHDVKWLDGVPIGDRFTTLGTSSFTFNPVNGDWLALNPHPETRKMFRSPDGKNWFTYHDFEAEGDRFFPGILFAPYIAANAIPGTDLVLFIESNGELHLHKVKDGDSEPEPEPEPNPLPDPTGDFSETWLAQTAAAMEPGEWYYPVDATLPEYVNSFGGFWCHDTVLCDGNDFWAPVSTWNPVYWRTYSILDRTSNSDDSHSVVFSSYDASKHSFEHNPLPDRSLAYEFGDNHVYGRWALDVGRQKMYRPTDGMWTYDITNQTWSHDPDNVISSFGGNKLPVAMHEGLGELLGMDGSGAITAWNPDTGSTRIIGSNQAQDGRHAHAHYNWVRDEWVIAFGDGGDVGTIVTADEQVISFTIPSEAREGGSASSFFFYDPISGNYLMFDQNNQQLWEYSPDLDQWGMALDLNGSDNGWPPYHGYLICPIPEAGVILWLHKSTYSDGSMQRLYKHKSIFSEVV